MERPLPHLKDGQEQRLVDVASLIEIPNNSIWTKERLVETLGEFTSFFVFLNRDVGAAITQCWEEEDCGPECELPNTLRFFASAEEGFTKEIYDMWYTAEQKWTDKYYGNGSEIEDLTKILRLELDIDIPDDNYFSWKKANPVKIYPFTSSQS